MLNQQLFVNNFNKASSENSSIGLGTFLGIDTFSKKGVAMLTKQSIKTSGSVITDLPIFATNLTEDYVFVQGSTGKVYSSVDAGMTWVDISPGTLTGGGAGLVMYQGFLFAFRGNGDVDYCVSPYTSANWTQSWQTGLAVTSLPNTHFPFYNPNDNAIYFANGNLVGKLFSGTEGLSNFDPGGTGTISFNVSGVTGTFTAGDTITDIVTGATGIFVSLTGPTMVVNANGTSSFNDTDGITNSKGATATIDTAPTSSTYYFNLAELTLPNIYQVNCISFLPPLYLSLGTSSSGIGANGSQIADIINWNPTLSTYESPLRLFSKAGEGLAGVWQLINRNNTLYAVTGGSHAIFQTNGQSFSLVENLSLYTTTRLLTGTGVQATSPVFLQPYPSALGIMGSQLYTGTSVGTSSSIPANYGLFPLGVWSVNFSDGAYNTGGETQTTQCDFPVSSGVICSTDFLIGLVYPTIQGQVLIGWYDGTNYGMDTTSFTYFQEAPTFPITSVNVWLESQIMQVGTPIQPTTVNLIELNFLRSLLVGQTVSVYWRTAYDQPYQLLVTFTSTSGNEQGNNSFKVTQNPFGSIKYLQLMISMCTASPYDAWSPELQSVVVS